MNTILSIGKNGLKSMQQKMDSVAEDLANVNTIGYKKSEVSFQELLINKIYDNEVLLAPNANNSGVNAGSKSGVATINFEQGTISSSSEEFHLSIEGNGFFGVRDQNGNLMLTRNGEFHINDNFTVTDNSGYPLEIDLKVPFDQWKKGQYSISSKGEITAEVDGQITDLGKIILYTPEVLDSLTPLGEGRYAPSQNSALYNSVNQENGFGSITQNSLELSNVNMVKTMADMIITQRAYSMNAKTVQTTDEIMSMINEIKR